MYILCKHMKLNTVVTSPALQQIKAVGLVANRKVLSILSVPARYNGTLFYVKFINFSLGVFVILNSRKLKLFRGHLFFNAVKISYTYQTFNIMYQLNCAEWQEASIYSKLLEC